MTSVLLWWDFWKWGNFLIDLQVHLAVLSRSHLETFQKRKNCSMLRAQDFLWLAVSWYMWESMLSFLQLNCHNGAYWKDWVRRHGYHARWFLRYRLEHRLHGEHLWDYHLWEAGRASRHGYRKKLSCHGPNKGFGQSFMTLRS